MRVSCLQGRLVEKIKKFQVRCQIMMAAKLKSDEVTMVQMREIFEIEVDVRRNDGRFEVRIS